MKLNCPGDYGMLREWLEGHKNADEIEYDTQNGLPRTAIYHNPIYTAYVEDQRRFWQGLHAREDGRTRRGGRA